MERATPVTSLILIGEKRKSKLAEDQRSAVSGDQNDVKRQQFDPHVCQLGMCNSTGSRITLDSNLAARLLTAYQRERTLIVRPARGWEDSKRSLAMNLDILFLFPF